MRINACLLLCAAVPLLGCTPLATSPAPTLPGTDVPKSFTQATAVAPSWPEQQWWQRFGSSELTALEVAVQKANADIAQAEARLRQADARAKQAGASLLPSVALNGNVQNFAGINRHTTGSETDFAVGLGASYELDFWGRNRAEKTAADALLRASVADRATVGLSVSAAIADSYFQVLALRERSALAQQNLQAAQATLRLVQRRVTAGFTAAADLAQARSEVATQQAALPVLAQQELEARNALAILLGRPLAELQIEAQSLAGLSAPTPSAGLPAELLTHRPDLVAAEANLAAAHADLTAVRAAMMPGVTLKADGNLQYPALNAGVLTLSGTGIGLSLSGVLTQTLFDGGRLQNKTAETQAREEELLSAYRAAVLNAFGDVENALGRMANIDSQAKALSDQVAQSEAVLRAAQRKYSAGAADMLVVTEAQQKLFNARDQQTEIHRTQLAASVMLLKALGGGWHTQPQ